MSRLLLVLLLLWPALAVATPHVVVSVKPLHSLVAGVMDGVGEPVLLLPRSESPHNFSLKPSDARSLQRADVVVWVGPELERFLIKPLETLSAEARMLTVREIDQITLLAPRLGGSWNMEEDRDQHGQEEHGEAEDYDPHLWLDPRNAMAIAQAAAELLAERDPRQARRYRANARTLQARLNRLDAELAERLEAVRQRPYVVFHDAYQYFEYRYRLNAVGSVTVNPERPPGARRIGQLRHQIKQHDAVCVFSEPQFDAALVRTLVRGTDARTGSADPLGAQIAAGPDAYFTIMRQLAAELTTCLGAD